MATAQGRMAVRRPPAARWLALLGPAFVAAMAYVDPGNVATNVTAGARFGYALVWVVVLANAMAVLVQYLSAKLGIVTERSLAEHLGRRLPARIRVGYWLQAEAVAIATDLAEVVGGAIALRMLFDLPLVVGAVITAAVAMAVLRIGDMFGQSALERLVIGFLALIAVGFAAGLVAAPPEAGALAAGLVPGFDGPESVLLASGIIGATVMPHVIYLHSGLTARRLDARGEGRTVRQLLAVTRTDVVAALVVAGLLNLCLLLVAAASLTGHPGTDKLEGVHAVVTSELGAGIALLFAVGLLSSGLGSTSVGSAAGAEIMNGLLGIRVPVLVRRLVTLAPALLLLGAGADPTRSLVLSQVALSLGIPFALVPLVVLTASRSVMGEHRNSPATTVAASVAAALVIGLNAVLLWLTFTG
ncbi:Nramp family divalent metal transporter [Phytohabitans sp. ZYX-F-186]|uniref:Nramp family divalent metal transporter n=1 Tax=Phytohabitans maris TaxID=3071409 RepID=A0ABU0ZA05_9ACTN|nr:Nramp family divalent metal transporter [Phytohabitans sp. ZYX-F-186]MDQ7903885.1 Nramp family divalent metal transporter [Phytohabitans sp. ZYX-F-186]